MILYNDQMIKIYKDKKKKGLKISFYPLLVVLPIFILFLILAKLDTVVLYIILSTIDLSIFACFLIYNIIENIVKSNDILKHINDIYNGYKTELNGNIINISKEITLKRNIHIIEIDIKNDNKINKVYLNIDLFENKFSIGDNIKVKLSNNFIIEYEA